MPHLEKPGPTTEPSGPKHGFAGSGEPTEFDRMMESGPEVTALEHAIRMAPAGWCFDSEEADGTD